MAERERKGGREESKGTSGKGGWEDSEVESRKGKGGKGSSVLPSSSFPTLNPGCKDLEVEKAKILRMKGI